jgi:hypothetical protein
MRSPTVLARAPVPSLGVVLVGCPDCRAVLGVDGAPGLPAALAAHRRVCPASGDVCGGCGCEAELYPRNGDWRCGDCLEERLFDPLASPPAPAPGRVRAVQALARRAERQAATEAEPAEKAVA